MQENLHQQFVQLGRERNKLTYKLLQLLPEIFKNGIYKKYAATIEEYAGRFGGLPKSLVKKRLNLEKHLENKPKLKEAIASQGVYKVALVARLATPETEAEIAEKVENMSKSALELFSKELRGKYENSEHGESREVGKVTNLEQVELGDGCDERAQSELPDFEGSRNLQPSQESLKVELEGEILFKFLRLKNKFNKNGSNKEIIKTIIEKAYQEEFAKEDKKVEEAGENRQREFSRGKLLDFSSGKICPGKNSRSQLSNRYIPVEQRRTALKQSNNRCGYPNCNRPYELFHHPERYSLTKNHANIVPLCKEHHEFAHNGLLEKQETRLQFIDEKYKSMRRFAIAGHPL